MAVHLKYWFWFPLCIALSKVGTSNCYGRNAYCILVYRFTFTLFAISVWYKFLGIEPRLFIVALWPLTPKIHGRIIWYRSRGFCRQMIMKFNFKIDEYGVGISHYLENLPLGGDSILPNFLRFVLLFKL